MLAANSLFSCHPWRSCLFLVKDKGWSQSESRQSPTSPVLLRLYSLSSNSSACFPAGASSCYIGIAASLPILYLFFYPASSSSSISTPFIDLAPLFVPSTLSPASDLLAAIGEDEDWLFFWSKALLDYFIKSARTADGGFDLGLADSLISTLVLVMIF